MKTSPSQLFSVTFSQALAKPAPAMVPPGVRRTQWRGWRSWLTLGALLLGGLNARASTLTVTSTADSGAGTLRAQIAAAVPGDTINFGVTGTIGLASEIAITEDLTIAGPGASSLTVSGSGNAIFAIGGGLVGISGLTLANGGYVGAAGGAIYMTGGTVTVAGSAFSGNTAAAGGAIYMSGGSLAITSSTFSNNLAESSGGAIDAVGGSLAVTNSTFLRNSANSFGGAIYFNGVSMVLASSTISMNSAGDGGGILTGADGVNNTGGGVVTIRDSTISSNTASYFSGQIGDGGGIFNNSSMKILNSTISGNSAITGTGTATYIGGGGIYNNNTLTIANSTITLNSARDGGGIMMVQGELNMSNSIVANNTIAGGYGYDINFTAGFTEGDYNLVQSFYASFSNGTLPGSHNITGQPALLGPLTNNGGPTLTHALLLGSPAIAAGDPNFNATGTPYDQRGPGFPRVLYGGLTIGAIEIEPNQSGSNFVVNSLADHDYGTCGLTDGSLREAVEYSPAGASITFGVTGTITLTLGELLINKNLTITGPASAPGITVSGNYASRIFEVTNGAALVNLSTLTLCSGNGSGNNGGALDVGNFSPSPMVNVTNCTFSGNTSTGNGGAIHNGATLTLTSCTLSGNSATNGGGAIQNVGTLSVTSCTFSGNSALGATAVGGGINARVGTLSLFNTIVAGNNASNGSDIYGLVSAGDYDLVQNPAGATLTGSHNITGQPALLGPLASNGGPTPTRALLAGSPAIDAGSTTLTTDQRGVARPQGAADDIGAFELGPIYSPTLSIQSIIPLAQVQISWYTVTNAAYQLQYCLTLTPDQWTPVSSWIVGGGQMISTNDPILADQPQRFYRVAVTNSP